MLKLSGVEHSYDTSHRIKLPDINVETRTHLLILGPSGSGKSTLLHILAGILAPSAGKVIVADQDFTKLGEAQRDAVRGKSIGIIFQRLYLSPGLSCLDTLRAAQYLAHQPVDDTYSKQLLAQLGLAPFERKFPSALSLGQAQRLAIARALVNRPAIVLADEPTSALDDKNASVVAELLKAQCESSGASLIVATHDSRLKSHFQAAVTLQ